MWTEFLHEIESIIVKGFNEKCSVEVFDDSEARFHLYLKLSEFSLSVVGTDARVSLRIKFSDCKAHIKDILHFSVQEIYKDTVEQLSPYLVSVWKNNENNYKDFPEPSDIEKNTDAYFEICTRPCDLSSDDKTELEIRALLFKSMEWITSYKYYDEDGAIEGGRQNYLQTRIERSEANRRRCIEIFGFTCQVCSVNLCDTYGELAEGFVHVHHIESIADSGSRWIDPSKDLIPVCPNCHSMLHRKDPPIHPRDLQNILNEKDTS